jgi:hypothetical protein
LRLPARVPYSALVMTQSSHNLGTSELLALLRDASLTPESIAEEIDCAGAQRCTAEQIGRARELLARLAAEEGAQAAGVAPQGPVGPEQVARDIAALPEPLALALARAAGEAHRSETLAELAQVAHKPLAKEAKRELQRLKQRGVQVREIGPQGPSVMKPVPEAEPPPSYASSIDAYGERAVWWARAAKGSVEVVQAVISDVKGILAIDALALPRRGFREFVKRLPRGGMVATAEVPKEHARHLIAAAAEEGARNGFAPPPAYADALRVLGPAPQPPPPSPGERIDFGEAGEVAHAMAGAALFADPLFMAWIPEEDALRSFALRVDEISVSRLYIDDAQRKTAFERASDDAAEAYFTPQRRARYARRLLEMAHVLESEQRLDTARASLAVARALLRDDGARNPFCRSLFAHALEDRLKPPAQPAPAPASGGLITPP